MTHLDEGTIHAWLDGALSAAEASDAQSHVDGCAECAAKVAEARGFIAGASRILTALDDVPAGVTPKRAPSTAPAIRQWRAAPWVTGIAATLVLAVGIRAYVQEPAVVALAERSVARFDTVAPARAKQAMAAAPAAPVSRPPALGDSALRRDAAAGAAGAAMREAREPAAPAEARSTAGAGASMELGPGRMAKRVAAGVADASSDAKKPAEDQVPAAAPMAFGRERGVRANAKPSDALELAGCYAIEQPTGPPTIVLLDTTRHTRGGFVARSAATREVIGAWNRIGGDSVRVDLLARGLHTIAASTRVACPQP